MQTYEYPERYERDPEAEGLYAAERDSRESLKFVEAEIAEAQKKAKRSPNKWNPVLSSLAHDFEIAKSDYDKAEAARNAYQQRKRDERDAVLQGALEAALQEIGPVSEIDGYLFLRIKAAGSDFDLMVKGYVSHAIGAEVELVKSGTLERVFGYSASVQGPRPDHDYRTHETTLQPAHVRWGSYSGMNTVAKARMQVQVQLTAVLVASLLNQVFGIDEPDFDAE